jgi:hypothetical protein
MMFPKKLDRFAAPFASALLYSQRLANMIVGVDVGYKYKAGKRTSELALRFHVSLKRFLTPHAPNRGVSSKGLARYLA